MKYSLKNYFFVIIFISYHFFIGKLYHSNLRDSNKTQAILWHLQNSSKSTSEEEKEKKRLENLLTRLQEDGLFFPSHSATCPLPTRFPFFPEMSFLEKRYKEEQRLIYSWNNFCRNPQLADFQKMDLMTVLLQHSFKREELFQILRKNIEMKKQFMPSLKALSSSPEGFVHFEILLKELPDPQLPYVLFYLLIAYKKKAKEELIPLLRYKLQHTKDPEFYSILLAVLIELNGGRFHARALSFHALILLCLWAFFLKRLGFLNFLGENFFSRQTLSFFYHRK
jgi:hypothetical protein